MTPRLLLSLLATATYLGHQYLLREALAIVLRTVGPTSVSRYLNFALGHGIGEEEWDGQDERGARGMEAISRAILVGVDEEAEAEADEWLTVVEDAQQRERPRPHRESTESSASATSGASGVSDDGAKIGESVNANATATANATARLTSPSRSSSMRSSATVKPAATSLPAVQEPVFHCYGFVSNKIGEACVCWLTRWGRDVLTIEAAEQHLVAEPEAEGEEQGGRKDIDDVTVSRADHPPVWGVGGIPAKFAAALLSADSLFVTGEMERYTMARCVLDLRRTGWAVLTEEDADASGINSELNDALDGWDEDEAELAKVFADGIYYSHMTFEDLSRISTDIDPDTALPYAPLAVLQAAHWTAADLKTRITHDRTQSPTSSPLPSPALPPPDELGLGQTTGEISALAARRRAPRSRMASPVSGSSISSMSFSSFSLASTPATTAPLGDDVFHPVPADATHRIGAGGLAFLDPHAPDLPGLPRLPDMPDMGPDWGDKGAGSGKQIAPPHGERAFFGIMRGMRTRAEIDTAFREDGSVGKDADERWTKVEPYR